MEKPPIAGMAERADADVIADAGDSGGVDVS
jgi:hypothetical protein